MRKAAGFEQQRLRETTTPEALVDAVVQAEFQTKDSQTTLALVAGEAIQPGKDQLSATVNTEAAIVILQTLQQKRLSREDAAKESPELNQAETARAFQSAIDDLVATQCISLELAAQVAQILPVENLKTVKGNYARFGYLSDTFPKDRSGAGIIEVGDKIIATFAEKIRQTALQAGVELTETQCQEVATKRVLMHEYGHAVKQTKKIVAFESAVAAGEKDEEYHLRNSLENTTNAKIAAVAPCPELAQVFVGEPVDSSRAATELLTMDERIASGFELIGLSQALQKIGVSGEQSQAMIKSIMQEEALKFREKQMVIEFARSKGLSITQLNDATSSLFISLHQEHPELAELCRGGFNAAFMGYNFPLTLSEITRFCQSDILTELEKKPIVS